MATDVTRSAVVADHGASHQAGGGTNPRQVVLGRDRLVDQRWYVGPEARGGNSRGVVSSPGPVGDAGRPREYATSIPCTTASTTRVGIHSSSRINPKYPDPMVWRMPPCSFDSVDEGLSNPAPSGSRWCARPRAVARSCRPPAATSLRSAMKKLTRSGRAGRARCRRKQTPVSPIEMSICATRPLSVHGRDSSPYGTREVGRSQSAGSNPSSQARPEPVLPRARRSTVGSRYSPSLPLIVFRGPVAGIPQIACEPDDPAHSSLPPTWNGHRRHRWLAASHPTTHTPTRPARPSHRPLASRPSAPITSRGICRSPGVSIEAAADYEPSAGRPGHRRERNGHASRSHWSISTARSRSRSARDARTHDRTIASAAPLPSGSM